MHEVRRHRRALRLAQRTLLARLLCDKDRGMPVTLGIELTAGTWQATNDGFTHARAAVNHVRADQHDRLENLAIACRHACACGHKRAEWMFPERPQRCALDKE